jgi:hypothetical protein
MFSDSSSKSGKGGLVWACALVTKKGSCWLVGFEYLEVSSL